MKPTKSINTKPTESINMVVFNAMKMENKTKNFLKRRREMENEINMYYEPNATPIPKLDKISNRKEDIRLAQLAFDTVIKVRQEGLIKHPADDGDEQHVNFHLQRAYLHCVNAKTSKANKTRMHIEHGLVRCVMALLKELKEIENEGNNF